MDDIQATIFYMMVPCFSASIEEALKQLLNSKHLYQNLTVEFPKFEFVFNSIKPKLITSFGPAIENTRPLVAELYSNALNLEWQVKNPNDRPPISVLGQKADIKGTIVISPPKITGFCHNCDGKEPYNFVEGTDVIYDFRSNHPTIQVFALDYECQGCSNGVPEVFLVRREGLKLTLSGRSPIEEIIVEPQIPKSHKKYMSDAILAFQSGQTLAGLFYLRTFIEQYIRSKSKTPKTDDIDSLFRDYGNTLSVNFKSQFPSLQSIYNNLSTAIHAADPSVPIYLKAKEEIEYHFEGKIAFRFTE